MSWKEKTYQETLDNIVRYYESKVRTDTTGTLVLVNQELQSQWVRPGNDWTGRWGGGGYRYDNHGNYLGAGDRPD